MPTENITSKHLTVGDTLLVGPRYPWGEDNPQRFPRTPHGDHQRLTVASIDRSDRHNIIVRLSDGTHVAAAGATRFCREL